MQSSGRNRKKKSTKKVLTFLFTSYIICLASDRQAKFESANLIDVISPGCGSVWLECLIWDQEVAGSNPVTPTDYHMHYAGVVQW